MIFVSLSYVYMMTGMTILEGVLCAVVDCLQLVKILTDENATKSSMAKVNQHIFLCSVLRDLH
jgi:hypothetical protein